MAVCRAKLSPLFRPCSSLLLRHVNAVAPATSEGQRQLTTDPKYKKPFPEWIPFTWLTSMVEYTTPRLNENSRIVCIDGLPCVGKTEFAKLLAEHFKLRYCPGFQAEDWYMKDGLDLRQLNKFIVDPRLKIVDLDDFYLNEEPSRQFSIKQLGIFRKRYFMYMNSMRYLLRTGIGTVAETSVWSDHVYAKTLNEMGYFARKTLRYYDQFRQNSMFYMWKPNLIIFLDAPTPWVIAEMKKKHPHYENSPVLTPEYIDLLRDNYRKLYLYEMKQYCEVLEYDVTNMEDMDLLLMDLEQMDLISRRLLLFNKWKDWNKRKEEDWSIHRLMLENPIIRRAITNWRPNYSAPDVYIEEMANRELMKLVEMYPELRAYEMVFKDPVSYVNPSTPAKGCYLDPANCKYA